METSGPAEVSVEPKERKKIQFAVPNTAPTQLDPRQVEMIRRRRPTPATLFRVADQSSPEDDNSAHQWVVGENGILKPKRVSSNVYQPPSLKAVQQMAEAQMQKLGVYPHMEEEGEEPLEEEEELLSRTAEPFSDSQEEMGMAEDQPELIKPMAMVRSDVEEEEDEEEEEEEEDEEEEDKETAENENRGVE